MRVTWASQPSRTCGPSARTNATDPLFDATDATNGGGDTGSVLISPYINPGTVSTVTYNHYSWLRTMEDLFGVASTSPGLDGLGHIGYAAQPGLAPFGPDVFNKAHSGGHRRDEGHGKRHGNSRRYRSRSRVRSRRK